jgi:lipid A 3-O-deacylase
VQSATNQVKPIWVAGVGEGFQRGADELGLLGGAGFGVVSFGSRTRHDWWLTSLRWGRILSDVMGETHWYRGNYEFMAEVFGGQQYHPDKAYLAGFTPHLRYNFATGCRLVPYLDGGAGFTVTDIRNGDLSTTFEFNLQVGAGLRWFLKDDFALTAEYKFIHLSNAHLAEPNFGVNNNTVLVGVNWFF